MKTWLKSAYQRMHAHLPKRMQHFVSDVAFSMPNRPFVYRDPTAHPQGGLARGSVTFSIDFEMAWATQYSKLNKEGCVSMGLRERSQVPQVLAVLNDHDVPATWATVGHLFLPACTRGTDGRAHASMPRVSHFDQHWEFTSGDWFQHDPCTNVTADPAWYAPDLIEMIIASRTPHEIGCHGFSHVGFGTYCPDEVVAAELDACIDAMSRYNLRPTSLVFPGNEHGKFDVIAARGFRSIRWFPVSWAEVSLPIKNEQGLWCFHNSLCIDTDDQQINLERRLSRLIKYVEKAIATRMNAHLWFHPSIPAVQMEALLFPVISYCARRRDKGVLDILTMDQLADAMEHAIKGQPRDSIPCKG